MRRLPQKKASREAARIQWPATRGKSQMTASAAAAPNGTSVTSSAVMTSGWWKPRTSRMKADV